MASPFAETITSTTSSSSSSSWGLQGTQLPHNFSDQSQAATQNASSSLGEGCIRILFSRLPFIPWDNPDNVLSEHIRLVVRGVRAYTFLVLFLIGEPANLINMAVFFKQGLRERVTLCLFALAFADWLYLTLTFVYNWEVLVQKVDFRLGVSPFIALLSNNYYLAFLGFYYASPILSSFIAADRCFCVFRPLSYRDLMSTRVMAVIVVCVYLLSFGLTFTVVSKFTVTCMYDPQIQIRFLTFVTGKFYSDHKEAIDFIDSFILGVLFRGGAMVVVMTMTALTIVKLNRIVSWRTEATSASSLSAPEVALTKMLVGNSILFAVCMLPTAAFRFAVLFFPQLSSGGRNQNLYLTLLSFSDIFSAINSSFNIFVYYGMGTRYRETFWAIFKRKPAAPVKASAMTMTATTAMTKTNG